MPCAFDLCFWPSLGVHVLWVLQLLILWHCLLKLMYCHVILYVSSCLYDINILAHAIYICIFVFLVVLSGKPVYWIDLVQACIWSWLCIGVYWVEFIIFSMISLLHPFLILPLVVYDLWLYSPLFQTSNDRVFQICIAYPVFLFLCCCIFFPCLTGSCLQM